MVRFGDSVGDAARRRARDANGRVPPLRREAIVFTHAWQHITSENHMCDAVISHQKSYLCLHVYLQSRL